MHTIYATKPLHSRPISLETDISAMLHANDLECHRGERRLFRGVDFQLRPGELLHVQGRNGSGKTSLLRMILGLLPPVHGEILWQGQNIREQADEYHAQLRYLGHHNGIKEELTPLENLQLSAALQGQPLDHDQAINALADNGLSGREDLPCKYLSQGQKRRVALASLSAARQALWILDEPFVALDTHAIERLAKTLTTHLQRGGLIVMTTHQAVDIPGVAVHSLVLNG